MATYHPELLARAVPRYTSYPTAAEFGDEVGPEDMERGLAGIGRNDPISLYVHIPFCQEICSYCGCNTARANRVQRLTAYIEALEAEIDMVARSLAGRGRFTRIAFGGGSPNAIEPLAFARLIDRLVTRFATAAPIFSIEIDPRSLDKPWLDTLKSIGVQRASLGVQTFDPAIQAAIGRVQPDALIAAAVAGLHDAGVSSLNFDLMYGLPAQSIDDVVDSVDRTVALGADRVALFGYAHLPSLLPRQRVIDASRLPGAEDRFAQALAGRERFVAAGYRAIGFDHFAKPGDPIAIAADHRAVRRNFQGFTDDDSVALIGLGASAISHFGEVIVQNEKLSGRYRMLVADGRFPGRRGVRLDDSAQERAQVIEDLLSNGRARPPAELLWDAAAALAPFAKLGLVRRQGGWLYLSSEAWPYARSIAACFDIYRMTTQGQFSHAV